jgi:TonB-linked SusC/RagA family outer membrane protein
MNRFDYTSFLKRWLMVLVLLSAPVLRGLGQYYASAGNAIRSAQASAGSNPTTESTVSLKDALHDLKKRFHLRFAYREGLLDGKTVSATWLHQEQAPEVILEKMLASCMLGYKQINKKQFTIFSTTTADRTTGNAVTNGTSSETSVATETAAQEQAVATGISGTVTSQDDGMALPGVNVIIKGTTTGTTTDSNGHFALNAPDDGAVLIFSFIGYQTTEVSFSAGQTVVDVVLPVEMRSLSEVVVTALGIEKERSALAYSVTEVKGEEFTQARENNVANALTGKIAGVNATGLSTGPGGSSRIVIRGNGSLTGANQPLYVVNGMPIDNTTPGGSATTNGGAGNVDRGDGIGGINPDDIESISVLKGGTAAALYGSRAANGVIVITTKKGRAQRGIGVEYNGTFTTERVSVYPDWQYEYGQGDNGVKPTDLAGAVTTGRRSFGAKIDGTDFVAVDGKTHPYIAQRDNVKNFYQTGTSLTNTLAFTGGSDVLSYRLSMSDLNSRSILPNSTYNRKTANLSINSKLGDRITVDATLQYNLEKAHNRPTAGDALGNPNWTPYMMANTADIRWIKPGYDANGNEIAWNDAPIASNAYFVANKYQEDDIKNRFIGQAAVSYKILKNLSLKGVVSRDFYNYNYNYIVPSGTLYVPLGQLNNYKTDVAETNGMLSLNYNAQIKDFSITAFVAGNQRRYDYKQLNIAGSNFTIPYFYSTTNLATQSTTPLTQRTGINSIFGSADFGYKDMAFITVTGRQDWFSTLSPKNNTIFYPSIGGSFVLSEAISMPNTIDFAKVRASWAQVGGATPDPYAINLTYSMVPSSGQPLQNVTVDPTTQTNIITNPNLKPLTSTTYEAGFELQFFRNRLGLDVTYYDRKTTDDIVKTAITPTSGYNSVILNVGELSNKGIEVLLTGSPIKNGAFTWNVSYNVAYNKNKVVRLADGLDQIQMASSVNGWAYINNIVGQPFGTIVGTRTQTDANGNIVFNKTSGLPVATGLQNLGQGVPPLTMGLTNEFRYKNFSLNILIDGKYGNKIFSLMEVYATRLGKMKSTLPGRENGLDVSGVDQEGNPYSRTVPVTGLRVYYDNYKIYSDKFIHDGSFVKLRQIIFSYNIPVKNLKVLKLQSASISFVARNLLTLYKSTDNFDPEQGYTNSSAQGFESFGLPRTRSYGMNLMLKF